MELLGEDGDERTSQKDLGEAPPAAEGSVPKHVGAKKQGGMLRDPGD